MTVQQLVRRRLIVQGVVQGVGFRPYLALLAGELGLAGSVHNDSTGVEVEVEGPAAAVDRFERRLPVEAPPLARIESTTAVDLNPLGENEFHIDSSTSLPGRRTVVPPDSAPCPACLRELGDPADRRYRHPFITCTHCGPRLSIILDLPYDRAATTMADFGMCPVCTGEYTDPGDRRFHAQPVSCHDCGPALSALTATGEPVAATGTEPSLASAVHALRTGRIVAIKGLGGYHLACDAADPAAVQRLRDRKQRPDQPFAVMTADLATAERLVHVEGATGLLTGPERPIVLLPRRTATAPLVTPEVAPGLDELGIVLPYTPLHHLLFAQAPDGSPGAPPALVMTSANVSGEPLCYTDSEALDRLRDIADLFLVHDRRIALPVEDSVLAWSAQTGAVPLRRSRGYAPLPVPLAAAPATTAVVLATGAELKSTVALADAGRVFVSAHVGDLESLAGQQNHRRVTERLLRFHRATPALIVADRHPGYSSRAWAREYAAQHGVPMAEVQHHHAHLASLAAEHDRLDEPLLGLVFDGTGYGCDGTVWGGELLRLGERGTSAERLGHLGAVRLPGGDAGVRNPVRTAAIALLDAGIDPAGTPVGAELTGAESAFLRRLHAAGDDSLVTTSSIGRLFDVTASLLGIRHRVSYEAQAAIELEATARRWRRQAAQATAPALDLPVLTEPDRPARIDPGPLWRSLTTALAAGADPGALAWSFHLSLAAAAAELAANAAAADAPDGPAAGAATVAVGLSGGVFANRLLLAALCRELNVLGLEPLTHQRVPAGDGGLSLGQAAVGSRMLEVSG